MWAVLNGKIDFQAADKGINPMSLLLDIVCHHNLSEETIIRFEDFYRTHIFDGKYCTQQIECTTTVWSKPLLSYEERLSEFRNTEEGFGLSFDSNYQDFYYHYNIYKSFFNFSIHIPDTRFNINFRSNSYYSPLCRACQVALLRAWLPKFARLFGGLIAVKTIRKAYPFDWIDELECEYTNLADILQYFRHQHAQGDEDYFVPDAIPIAQIDKVLREKIQDWYVFSAE